jgi:hypothetical protein
MTRGERGLRLAQKNGHCVFDCEHAHSHAKCHNRRDDAANEQVNPPATMSLASLRLPVSFDIIEPIKARTADHSAAVDQKAVAPYHAYALDHAFVARPREYIDAVVGARRASAARRNDLGSFREAISPHRETGAAPNHREGVAFDTAPSSSFQEANVPD